jgi:hypothetical protein
LQTTCIVCCNFKLIWRTIFYSFYKLHFLMHTSKGLLFLSSGLPITSGIFWLLYFLNIRRVPLGFFRTVILTYIRGTHVTTHGQVCTSRRLIS